VPDDEKKGGAAGVFINFSQMKLSH